MNIILRTPRALVMLPLLLLLVSADALAWGSCAAIFSTTFGDSQTESQAGCLTCHSDPNGGPFNRYGDDLRANGARGAGFDCDAADFAQALLNVQDLDSDGEGNINSVEIAASTQPAWCDSALFPGCTNPGTPPTGITLDPGSANEVPVANPGGPYSGQPGIAIAFDGSASADPNDDPITYFWDFGDGITGSGESPSHAYNAAGTYEVSLVVSDGVFESAASTSQVEVSDSIAQGDGEVLYNVNCLGCHGDPWVGPAVDETIFGLRRVSGSRSCNIEGSIFGTSVFPNGVPEMQHLQRLSETEIVAIADYLNSREISGEWRYVSTCAGCHGNDGSGGRVGENVLGDSASETREAIAEESEMRYLACMPQSDIVSITNYLLGPSGNNDGDDIDDDEKDRADSSGGGASGLPLMALLSLLALRNRRLHDAARPQ